MGFLIYQYTNRGSCDKNEDCAGYCYNNHAGLFVLADGLGGHRHGEAASKIAVDTMLNKFSSNPSMTATSMEAAVCQANAEILQKQKEPSFSTIRTTLAALYFDHKKTLWAHAGDSRVYYFHKGQLHSVTMDHSVTAKKYSSGQIMRNEMNHDDDRTSLLNALGKDGSFFPEIGGFLVPPSTDDAFLLCSDGFWENVYDSEIMIDLAKSETPHEWVDSMLVRSFSRIGDSCDNLTAIAIMAKPDMKTEWSEQS